MQTLKYPHFKISDSKTFFLKLVQANLLSLQNKANLEKPELSIMKYKFTKVRL